MKFEKTALETGTYGPKQPATTLSGTPLTDPNTGGDRAPSNHPDLATGGRTEGALAPIGVLMRPIANNHRYGQYRARLFRVL
jgi:hypothetical protein